jgi:hypothetical protein
LILQMKATFLVGRCSKGNRFVKLMDLQNSCGTGTPACDGSRGAQAPSAVGFGLVARFRSGQQLVASSCPKHTSACVLLILFLEFEIYSFGLSPPMSALSRDLGDDPIFLSLRSL